MTKVNIYAGFDVSKKNLDLCLLQHDGKQVIKQFGYDDADLLALAGTLPEACHCIMEATGPYYLRLALWLHSQGLDSYIVRALDQPFKDVDWTSWDKLLEAVHNPKHEVEIALVGKYIDLPDAYLSVTEALRAGGFAPQMFVSEDVEVQNLQHADGKTALENGPPDARLLADYADALAMVQGRTLTSWPTLQDDIRNAGGKWANEQVVEDGNWISSRRPGCGRPVR